MGEQAKKVDELRELIDYDECIAQLTTINSELVDIESRLNKLSTITMSTNKKAIIRVVDSHRVLLMDRMSILRERANINFKKLKFGLPELRSLEISDPEGKNPMGVFAEAMKAAANAI